MKVKLSQERYTRVTNANKLWKSLLTFVNKLVFQAFGETLSKRNKKREICYKIALWKVETIVDVKRQKQSQQSVLKILIETFYKLNGLSLNSRFCSFGIFHWYLTLRPLKHMEK